MESIDQVSLDRIQFISDTHLEHEDRPIHLEKVADTIALLGDIGWINEESYWNFITKCSNQYKRVFILMGNHEYYNQVLQDVDKIIETQIKKRKLTNILYFHNRLLEFANVFVWGGTLWTKPSYAVYTTMNDAYYINEIVNNRHRKLSISKVYRMYNNAVKSIEEAIHTAKSTGKPLVVMTHHAPLLEMNGQFQGTSRVTGYASDLSHLFQCPISAWICGHTHQNITCYANQIPCSANCLGYPSETLPIPYNPGAFISIK